jgi:hypothetical protein
VGHGSDPAGLVDQDVQGEVRRVGSEGAPRLGGREIDGEAGPGRGAGEASRRRIDVRAVAGVGNGRGHHGEPRMGLEPVPGPVERRQVGSARGGIGRPEGEPDHAAAEPEQDEGRGGRCVEEPQRGSLGADRRRLARRLGAESQPAGPYQRDGRHERHHGGHRVESPRGGRERIRDVLAINAHDLWASGR